MTAWADKWGMSFNTQKCMVMHYGQRNDENPYYMAGERLKTTKEETDIGMLVTNTLKPGAQCAKAAKTASTVLGQLTRAFHFRDRHTNSMFSHIWSLLCRHGVHGWRRTRKC
jgi:hypothetical protein